MQSGLSLTTASGSVAIGASALALSTTGNHNIAIGNAAMNGSNTTGDNNIAIGATTGDALTSGKDNVFIGNQAGIDVNSGHSNVLIGLQAGHDLTTGFHNVAIGSFALDEVTDVDYTVCIGFGAGSSINSSDADSTVAIGNESLLALTDGQRNVAVGYGALKTEDTGDNSTAVGYEALKVQNNNTGANTAVGMRAGLAVSSGYSNTLLGSGAGATLSTGYNNTYIGRDADGASGRINSVALGHATTAQADNSVTLGNTDTTRIYTSENQCDASVYAGQVKLSLNGEGPTDGDFSGTGATVGLHISSSGVPYVKFTETNAASSGTADFEMYAANGAFVLYDVDDSAQVFNVNTSQVISGDFNDTSDIGLKENIVSISEGLSIINQLNPVTFDWKKKSKGTNSGFIAQEVEKILPDDVNGTDYDESLKDLPPSTVDNAGKSINLGGIVAHLTKAVQELSDKNEALEKRIAELESN